MLKLLIILQRTSYSPSPEHMSHIPHIHPLTTHIFTSHNMTESQQKKLAMLRNKRVSHPATRSIGQTPMKDQRQPHRRETTSLSPYRTVDRSQRRLTTIYKQPQRSQSEDRPDKITINSLGKIKSRQKNNSNAKLNFRLRVYSNPLNRKLIKPEILKSQQRQDLSPQAQKIYDKLFRRRKYGLQVSNSKNTVPAAKITQLPLSTQEDQISRNYIQRQIFTFQNESLQFGYGDLEPKSEQLQTVAPRQTKTLQKQSTDKKKFRRSKYQEINQQDFETIERRDSNKQVEEPLKMRKDSAIMIRQVLDNDPLDDNKRTIESKNSQSQKK